MVDLRALRATSHLNGYDDSPSLDASMLLLGHTYPVVQLGNYPAGCSALSAYSLLPGSDAVGCVAFALPIGKDRTTLKFAWTAQAGQQWQQPTYFWTFNNTTPISI